MDLVIKIWVQAQTGPKNAGTPGVVAHLTLCLGSPVAR